MGLPNFRNLSIKLSSKWILKSLLYPDEDWTILSHRHRCQFSIKGFPRWKILPFVPLVLTSLQINPKGSPLVERFWNAGNIFKCLLSPANDLSVTAPWYHLDSIWFSLFSNDSVPPNLYGQAFKQDKQGLKLWGDLWDFDRGSWKPLACIFACYRLSSADLDFINNIILLWSLAFPSLIQFKGVFIHNMA